MEDQKASKENEFKGILFSLKKRRQNPVKSNLESKDFITLGYYDSLKICNTACWYDFRPGGLIKHNLSVSLEDEFIDSYTIKALFPKDTDILEEKGFCYTCFEEECYFTYPYITISLLTVSEELIEKNEGFQKITDAINRIVGESIAENNEEFACAVFPTIGYSDFVIVFLANQMVPVAHALDRIRKHVVEEKFAAISSLYTVWGFNSGFKEKDLYQNLIQEDDVKLSIHINLKPGISVSEFMIRLKNEVVKNIKENGGTEEECDEVRSRLSDKYYSFGNSDSVLIPQDYIQNYLPLYLEKNILSPDSRFFRNNIVNTYSQLQIKENQLDVEVTEADAPKGNEKLAVLEKKFLKTSEKLKDFVQENFMQRRAVTAMLQLMKDYLNIAQLPQCFEGNIILGNIFEGLIENIEYVMAYVEDYKKKEREGKISEEVSVAEQLWCLECFYDGLNIFRNEISLYVTDIIRADKFFVEGQDFIHSSVGSAAKLLFVYNSLINQLMQVMRGTEDRPVSHFKVLIKSGRCDRTNVNDVFAFVGNVTECPKILIATIPEMSLYDLKGTMFRLFHESMHFTGERCREERFRHILRALTKVIGINIARLHFDQNGKESYEKTFKHYFKDDSSKLEAMIKKAGSIYEEIADNTAEKIARCIAGADEFAAFCKKTTDKETDVREYYLANLINGPEGVLSIDAMAKLLMESGPGKKENVKTEIYHILKAANRELMSKLAKILEQEGISYSKYHAYLIRDDSMKKKEEEGVYDENTVQFLEEYFAILFEELSGEIQENIEIDDVKSYRLMRDDLVGAMKESFADCFAAKALDIEMEDFLLAFIYECWKIDIAMPCTTLNIFRMGADLKILYGIKEQLSAEQKEKVRSKAKHWEKLGYEYKNQEELLNRIDFILSEYECWKEWGIPNEIEDYLEKCIDKTDFSVCERFKKFNSICNLEDVEKTYEMMEYLAIYWRGLRSTNEE